MFLSQPCSCTASHAGIPSQPVLQEYSPQKRSKYGEQSVFLPVLTEKRRNSLKYRLQSAMLFYILPLCGEARGKEGQSVEERRLSRVRRIG